MSTALPRESAKLVSSLAKFVKIDIQGVKNLTSEVAKCLTDGSLSINGFSQFELHPSSNDVNAPDELFVLDTLNFCFWSPHENEPKWKVSFRGKQYTGYFALCAAVCRAKEENIPITDPKFYSTITKEKLEFVMRSDTDVKIPLLDERVACLHEVGKTLLDEFDGTFKKCVEKCDKSAEKLLSLIVNKFPCFRDEAEYNGHKVSLYKRAQILVGDIWACYKGTGLGQFHDIDVITMFADYRVPQVLVHFGAMSYTEELMKKLQQDDELKVGSAEEVEIRACSIQVVEMVCTELRTLPQLKDVQFNSIMIDHFLWDYRRQHAVQLSHIPFHKTKGIYY